MGTAGLTAGVTMGGTPRIPGTGGRGSCGITPIEGIGRGGKPGRIIAGYGPG